MKMRGRNVPPAGLARKWLCRASCEANPPQRCAGTRRGPLPSRARPPGGADRHGERPAGTPSRASVAARCQAIGPGAAWASGVQERRSATAPRPFPAAWLPSDPRSERRSSARTPIASAGDSGRPGSEIGGGEGTAEESPPAGRVTDETDYFRLADDPGAIMWLARIETSSAVTFSGYESRPNSFRLPMASGEVCSWSDIPQR